MVSIILTSYDQEKYVLSALDSVRNQDYPNLELIVVDNGSTDRSPALIADWLQKMPTGYASKVILRNSSLPYCQSFNEAFSFAKGRYLVDLSGDDELVPGHISRSVIKMKESIGAACCFSDIWLRDEKGKRKTFYKRDKSGHLKQKVKIGEMYRHLVGQYVLPSVSLVFDSNILRKEGGYDESLSYEDFDIMVRLARNYPFVFSNHIGVIKNIHSDSFSAGQYAARQSKMLDSTLKVCQKIKQMNRRPKEDQALLARVYHEAKHALWSGNFDVAKGFLELAEMLGGKGVKHGLMKQWSSSKIDLSSIYSIIK